MTSYFCLSITLLDAAFHGRGDDGQPEWPPSPLRAFQALVAAAAGRRELPPFSLNMVPALEWLESLDPPEILAPSGKNARRPHRLYVPNNSGDLVVKAWAGGNHDVSMASHRVEKDVWPTWLVGTDPLIGGTTARYLWRVAAPALQDVTGFVAMLSRVARSITHLGWGLDLAAGHAALVDERDVSQYMTDSKLERWAPRMGNTWLRVPRARTTDDSSTIAVLMARHEAFARRMASGQPQDIAPLTAFQVIGYRRASDVATRPHEVFELRNDDQSRFRYSQAKFIHIAGMVRHLAIETMKRSSPRSVGDPSQWVDSYVAGHRSSDTTEHSQFSYLPLPSIGHTHTDPSVRRVMVAAPLGDDRLLAHLAQRLAGQLLKPTAQTRLEHPPTLVRVEDDVVARWYINAARAWASVTPVILPGHDDHKPNKTRRLIEIALHQSGVDQPCEFDWSAFSQFPKSLSAHKYDRHKRPTGYIRPDHLLSQTAVHLKLRFKDGISVPGPLVIGAGRHCGFGLMAGVD